MTDEFTSEHDGDSVREEVSNLAIVPMTVNICYTLDLIVDNIELSNDFRPAHRLYSHAGYVRYETGDSAAHWPKWPWKGESMQFVEILGFVAGTCTTAAFLPQVVHVWRTRSASDISLGMYCVFLLGVVLWLAYGIIMSAVSMILANGITLLLAGLVLFMKLRFERTAASADGTGRTN
ncbi:MAG: SemiSWEET transporter [Propionivibrio sp.]